VLESKTVFVAEEEVNIEAGVFNDNSSPIDVTLLHSKDASFAGIAAIVLSTGGSFFRIMSVNSTRLMLMKIISFCS